MLTLGQVIVGVQDLDAASDRFRAMGFDVVDATLADPTMPFVFGAPRSRSTAARS